MCIYVSFGGSRVTYNQNAFIERYPRGIQKSTQEPPTPRGSGVMAASSFTFQRKVNGEGRPKNAISRDFWLFSNFDVFLKGVPRGIQKSKRDLPTSRGTRDMAAQSFHFIGKHEAGPAKKCNFLNYWFSEP